jgi:hypothetical protein
MSRIFTVAVILAFLQFAPAIAKAQYYTSAPWCAVISLGAGDVHWECIYQSIEQCRPTILAGNRGFCNPNPYYVGVAEPRRSRRARPN